MDEELQERWEAATEEAERILRELAERDLEREMYPRDPTAPDVLERWSAGMPREPEPEVHYRTHVPRPARPASALNRAAITSAIGEALARERKSMREHCEKRLREELTTLRAELAELRGYALGIAAVRGADEPEIVTPRFLKSGKHVQ
jgi:hypothetical protein